MITVLAAHTENKPNRDLQFVEDGAYVLLINTAENSAVCSSVNAY